MCITTERSVWSRDDGSTRALRRYPVALAESGVGRIRVVHADGQEKVEMGLSKPIAYAIVTTRPTGVGFRE